MNEQDIFKEQILAEVRKNPLYITMKENYETNKRRGNIAQACLYFKKMKQFEADKFVEAAHVVAQKQKFVDDFVNSLNEDDRKNMNILANAMVMLSDVLETMIFDVNTILKKYNASKMTEFNKLSALLKETKGFVRHFDTRLNDEEASFMFGQMSDNLYEMIFNKSASFVRKLKAYEKKRNKNTPRNAEVA
jgi:hypothetical protein